VTRKLKPDLDADLVRRCVRTLLACEFVAVDQATIGEAWSVQDRFGFSFWDSLVVDDVLQVLALWHTSRGLGPSL